MKSPNNHPFTALSLLSRISLLMGLLLSATTVQAYTLFSDRGSNNGSWPGATPTITYYWNNAGSQDILAEGNTLAQYEQVIIDAFARYTSISDSTLTYVNGGPTAAGFTSGDGLNTITTIDTAWPFSSTTSGLASTSFNPVSGFSAETDIVMNGENRTWTIVGTQGNNDFASTLTHEIGHMSGLDHSPLRAATMYPSGSAIGSSNDAHTRRATLSTDDISGISVLYGTGAGTGSISGTITSDIGGQGIPVGAINTTTGNTYMAITGGLAGQANQEYTIQRLPPGDYKIFIIPTNSTVLGGGFQAGNFTSSLSNVDSTFQPRFYDNASATGTAVIANADNVTVTSGANTPGININPPSAAGTRQLYYYSNQSNGSSTGGALHQGTEDLFYAIEPTTTSATTIGATLGTGVFSGLFFNGAGIGGVNINVYRQPVTTTAAQAGLMFTPYIEHAAGEIDFDPGAIERVVYPRVEYSGAAIVSALPIDFAVTFNEAVTGLTTTDFVIGGNAGATAANTTLLGSGATYTLRFNTVPGDGTIVVGLAPEKVVNASGIANIGSTSSINSVMFNATPPSYTTNLTLISGTPTNVLPAEFTVEFSEVVTGFTAADVTVNAGTTTGTPVVNVTGSGAGPYTVSVSGLSGNGTVQVQIIGAGIFDVGLSSPPNSAVASFVLDTTPPTYAANLTRSTASPTNALPATFSVQFSEAVTGFTEADVSINQGTTIGTPIVNVTGGPTNYNITVTNLTGNGTITAQILGAGITDAAGNSPVNSATANVLLDTTAPGYATNLQLTSPSPTNTLPASFSVQFTEAVTGFTSADVSVNQGTTLGTPSVNVTGSGAGPYTIEVTGLSGTGTIALQILGAGITDAAGNAAPNSATSSVQLDTIVPNFTLYEVASTQPNPTNVDSFSYEITFTEAINPASFTAADINTSASTVTGTLTPVISGSGAGPYTITISGATSDGDVTAAVNLTGITDLAGNAGVGSTLAETITYNTTAPAVATFAVAAAQADPTNVDSFTFEITFTEAINPATFTAADVDTSSSTVGGTLIPVITGSGAGPYTIVITGASVSGDVTVSVNPAGITDTAGNAGVGSSSTLSIEYDVTAPTVSLGLASGQSNPTTTLPINLEANFSEPIESATLTALDFDFTGTTAAGMPVVTSITGSGAGPYAVVINGLTGTGIVSCTLNGAGIVDLAGNAGTGTSTTSLQLNQPGPTVSAFIISAAQPNPTNVDSFSYEITFDAPINASTFTASDIDVTGTTVIGSLGATITGTGAGPYTIVISGATTNGVVSLAIDLSGIQDLSANPGTGTTAPLTITYDTTAPTASAFIISAAQANPTNVDSFSYEITFNEAIDSASFTAADVITASSTVTGTLVPVISGSGAGPYTIVISGATSDGDVIASVDLTGITDVAGNAGVGTTAPLSITYSSTGPSITAFAPAATQPNPTNLLPIVFALSFNEAITTSTLTALDFDFTGTTAAGTPAISSITGSGSGPYLISVIGLTGSGTLAINVDAAGVEDALSNVGSGTASTSVVYDNTGPGISAFIISATQPDPATFLPIEFQVTFDEPINSATLSGADIDFSGTTAPGAPFATNFSGVGAGPYTFEVFGLIGNGDLTASVLAAGVQDVAGNAGTVNSGTVTIAYTQPSTTITSFTLAAGQTNPAAGLPVRYEVTFSGPINTGTFDGGDIGLAGSTAFGSYTASVVSGSGAGPFVIEVAGSITVDGTINVGVVGSGILDLNGLSVANNSPVLSVALDSVRPQITTFNLLPTPGIYTNSGLVQIEVFFNKPIVPSTFDSSDVSVVLGTATGTPFVSVISGTGAGPYVVRTSGFNAGTLTVSYNAAGVTDLVGNVGQGIASLALTYDPDAPTLVSIAPSIGQASPTSTLPISFTVELSEAVLGFNEADVFFTGTNAAGTPIVDSVTPLGGGIYEIQVSGFTGSGDVVISIDLPGVRDLAGNPGIFNTTTATVVYTESSNVAEWEQVVY
ncbi:MAG: Ig-like domain-containing protein [Sumerlaeia bacterium]